MKAKRGILALVIVFLVTISGCAQRECNPGETKDCGLGIGECKAGIMECTQDGVWGVCNDNEGNPVQPTGKAETCNNSLDDNCNGETDENCGKCADDDKDGYFKYDQESCPGGNDCDDTNNKAYPRAREICVNDIDDDCDSQVDESCKCIDNDKDGYPLHDSVSCQTGTDCNDVKSGINPGRDEVCNNGLDDDCNTATPDECSCIDDDYDKDPIYVKGNCAVGPEKFADICLSDTKLKEYSCISNKCQESTTTCKTSCVNGRCIKSEIDLKIKITTADQPSGIDDLTIRFAQLGNDFDSLGLFKGLAEESELLFGKLNEKIGSLSADKSTTYDMTIKSPLTNSRYDKVVINMPSIQNGTKLTEFESKSYTPYTIEVLKDDISDISNDRTKTLVIPSGNIPLISINTERNNEGLMLPDGTKTRQIWIAKGLVDKNENMYDIIYYNNFYRDERYYGSLDLSKSGIKIASINYGKTTGDAITIVSEATKEIYA